MREQENEQEQEHDPSKVAVEINIPPNNRNTFLCSVGGRGPPSCSILGEGIIDVFLYAHTATIHASVPFVQ